MSSTAMNPSSGSRPTGRPRRDPAVEANSRLSAMAGLLLIVMLAAEGLTILSIHPLLAWHVAIGMALIPPVGLKLGSTIWRFSRYYLGDPAYVRAGAPHPVLRILGPVVVLTTVAVLATGIGTWLAGPHDHLLAQLHKASFVLWFGAMTIHVLAHTPRAVVLATEEAAGSPTLAHRRTRYGLVLGSLAAGVVVALATRGVATGWTH